MPTSCYEPLDDALELLAAYDIELKNGNSNHAPMVAEALLRHGPPGRGHPMDCPVPRKIAAASSR